MKPSDARIFEKGHLPDDFADAVLLVDKPGGCTSFDVIRTLRRLFPVRKVGHAGTLDPMATGLLICLLGRGATRRMQSFMELRKAYEGTLRLGEVTPSYDAETPVSRRADPRHITAGDLEGARRGFLGDISQIPPMYSARRVGGERLYRKARRGETVERRASPVHVFRFELSGRSGADVSFDLECSKGTYVRALAHDFGRKLGVGAHLVALRRTAIGPYRVERAWTLQELEKRTA